MSQVQVLQRLVEQIVDWLLSQYQSQTCALPLAAGQPRERAPGERGQLEQIELLACDAFVFQRRREAAQRRCG